VSFSLAYASSDHTRALHSFPTRRSSDLSKHHTETLIYGYGLETRLDSRFGRVVCHSGGYPGYGSHMRWFPELGLSIVVLGSTTYYPAQRSVQNAVDAGWAAAIGTPDLALDRSTTSAPVPRYEAQPAQIQTVLAAANLVTDFDEAVADEIFSMNMDLDEPRVERRERFAQWARDHGLASGEAFSGEQLVMSSPLRGTVTLPADGAQTGPATITVGLNHLGQVQAITFGG